MLEVLNSLTVSLMIFVCTFAAAILGMVLHGKLPDSQLTEDSKDVIKLVMGLIATMAALVLGLLIASAKSSYDTQRSEVQQASASIVELDTILAHYGPEASESRQKLREVVAAAAENLWPRGGVLPLRPGPPVKLAESATFYESIANLSPRTEAQRFIQNRALATSASVRQMRPLMLEQMGSSIPWPFLAVLIFWISMLFLGFGLFARFNATVVVAFLIGALSVSSSIFLILEMNQPYRGLMRLSDAPLRTALDQIGQ
jgi:membrane-bound ClpP family serine protease